MSGEKGIVEGLIVGLVLGTVLGVLFAPAAGKETRSKVKGFLDDLPVKSRELEKKIGKVLKKTKKGVEEAA